MIHRRLDLPDARPWWAPLGCFDEANKLAAMVSERSSDLFGETPVVDLVAGVIHSEDGLRTAGLGPLARQVANVPVTAWQALIERERRRWRTAMMEAERSIHGQPLRWATPDVDVAAGTVGTSAVALRLTSAPSVAGSRCRPAFGPLVWEAVNDVGSSLLITPSIQGQSGPAPAHRAAEELWWDAVAADTVARHQGQWAALTLPVGAGLILSGPYVAALLYDVDRLMRHVGSTYATTATRVRVVANTLLLVVASDGSRRHLVPGKLEEELSAVAASLDRFSRVADEDFAPLTLTVCRRNHRLALISVEQVTSK